VEDIEPIEVGADICAGSLLKNLGGGIAKTGAYITGKKNLVDACADMLVAPGMGFETLPNLGFTASFLQGLFLSPLVVRESLLGNLYMSCFMQEMGFVVEPSYTEARYDIVLKIATQNKNHWQNFADTLQSSSPLDSFVSPEAFEQKGYPSPIIMAGGTFTTGSSIEFSVDGFASDPYYMYYQAGMVAEQTAIFARALYAKFN
jgi:cystathionine beta-lyase family protein involved in aluminum resistance